MMKLLLRFLVRHHFTILLGILAICLTFEGFFLYRYFWRALTETRIVYELKQKASIEELKTPLLERAKAFQSQKVKERSIDWNTLHDPFTVRSGITRMQDGNSNATGSQQP